MEVLTFDAWDDAIRDLKSSADKKSFMLMSFIEFDMELPDFSFTQKGLEFSHSSDDFLLMAGKQIVERKFYTYVRQKQSEGVVISRSIKASFQNTLNLHIRKIKQIAKQHGYIRPPYKEKLDDFTWLIDYLVSDVPSRQTKKQEEIAATYGKPLQTISDGINRAARLLGIKLQGHKRGLKKGQTLKRKPETKEAEATAKAARLPRTIEAITNCANPESNKIVAEKLKISPSHFGRTWKPYVLEQARHILGCPSLTWEEFISRENQQEVRRRLKLR